MLLGSAVAAAAVPARGRSLLHLDRGVIANERLTAPVGAALFALLAAVAVATLSIPGFLAEHYIVGLLLVPPVVLKLGATGYRFARYYTRSVAYRLAGPPPALMRAVSSTEIDFEGSGPLPAICGQFQPPGSTGLLHELVHGRVHRRLAQVAG